MQPLPTYHCVAGELCHPFWECWVEIVWLQQNSVMGKPILSWIVTVAPLLYAIWQGSADHLEGMSSIESYKNSSDVTLFCSLLNWLLPPMEESIKLHIVCRRLHAELLETAVWVLKGEESKSQAVLRYQLVGLCCHADMKWNVIGLDVRWKPDSCLVLQHKEESPLVRRC